MEKLKNGYKQTVKRKLVKPYLYHDGLLTVSAHYRGYVSRFENSRKLWTKSTGIDRVSRGGAQKDAYQLKTDLIMQNVI